MLKREKKPVFVETDKENAAEDEIEVVPASKSTKRSYRFENELFGEVLKSQGKETGDSTA